MSGKQKVLRKCVGCGEMKEKVSLVRVMKTPEDDFILDKTNRANGRGAYICKDALCFQKALKNKGLERSLKCKIPDEIIEQLEKEISNAE